MAKEKLQNVTKGHHTKQMVVRINIVDAMHSVLDQLLEHLIQGLLAVEVNGLIGREELCELCAGANGGVRVLEVLHHGLVDKLELSGVCSNLLLNVESEYDF